MTEQWFPPMDDYVLSHRCPTCKAEPWTDCDAPQRQAKRRKFLDMQQQWRDHYAKTGRDYTPAEPGPRSHLQHAARQDAGRNHYQRDLVKAPWTEDRVPGQQYGTVDYTGAVR